MATTQQLLDAVNDLLVRDLSRGAAEYEFRGRRLGTYSLKELREFRKELQREVDAEERGWPIGHGIRKDLA